MPDISVQLVERDIQVECGARDIHVDCVHQESRVELVQKRVEIGLETKEIHVQFSECLCSGTSAGGDGEIIEAERFILTETDISNRFLLLTYMPLTADEIGFQVKNAPTQHYGSDYRQDPTFFKRVTWEGLELDGILQAGDRVTITYTR